MPIEITTALIGVIAALLGAWAGSTISRKSANDIRVKQEFNKAAAMYRCAFTKEIRLIEESTIDTNFINIFSISYIRHRNAIIKFKPYLSETKRTEIEKAWEKHCYPQELNGYERTLDSAKFIHYAHAQKVERKNGNPVIIEEHEPSFEKAKNSVEKNINSLLSFAEMK